MATDVPMPKLGLTMEEATIIEWLVADGDEVALDQPLLRIETDKTETDVASPGAGRVHQMGKPGDVFACGVRIGVLLGDGETPPAAAAPAAAPAAPAAKAAPLAAARPVATPAPAPVVHTGRVVASPYARSVAASTGVNLATVRGTGPGGRVVAADVLAAPAGGHLPPLLGTALYDSERALSVASVAARNLADLLGIDLAQVPVDPIEQRITRDGVALYVRHLLLRLTNPAAPLPDLPAAAPAPAAPAFTPAPLLQEPTEIVRMSGMRGTIAKRMHASLQEMAQLTMAMDADMSAVVADRADRKATGGALPSFTDYVVAACARALLVHPRMNSQISEAGLALLPEVHVGLAVAVPNGLLVPVVRDAAHRDLADLSAETTRLATEARAGSLPATAYEGGTFSVSALGAFGVDMFTPVINPPNAGIMGVGRLRKDLTLLDSGEVGTVPRLTLSLTWDHRVVDGVPAAEFCRTVVELLAEPRRLD